MTTITFDNNKYIVKFDEIECNQSIYDTFDLAQWLCWLRLGTNIRFLKIPFINKWLVINSLNLFV